MIHPRRTPLRSTLVFLAAFLGAALVGGCSDNGTEPAPVAPAQGDREADLLESMLPATALIEVRAGPSSWCSATALSVIRRRVCSSSSARRFMRYGRF